jgi:hypothetical protein
MSAKQKTVTTSATEMATNGEETAKASLQRQMEEARESISETVTEIKDTVVDQYQSVKESVANTLDWQEQFRSHPVAWSLGALSVGYVIGSSIAASFKDSKDDELLSYLSRLGDHVTDELSRRGMNILMPALTGTVLVPMLTSKINELFGIDLSDLPNKLSAPDSRDTKTGSKGKKGKKGKTKKNGKKKSKAVSASVS